MSPRPTVDLPTAATQRELPQRRLNALIWGHSSDTPPPPGSRASTDPVKLGGCGRVCEGGRWVPVYDTGDRWTPGAVAICGNAMLCDYCAGREQARSAARYGWHFEDWLQGGGQLLHLTLSFSHGTTDDLDTMLADLKTGFERLRRSTAWKRAGIVNWVRVLHIRWSPEAGFHPHYHVTAFVRIGHPLDEASAAGELQAAWRDRIAKSIGRQVSRRHGMIAKIVGSAWGALYAWHWADPDDERQPDAERRDPSRDDLGPDYDPRHLDEEEHRRSWPLYRVAEAALDGDRQAWRAWEELCRAMKGVPVVRCSQMLTKVWKAHEAEQEPAEAPEVGEPVAIVHSTLWEKARRAGATEMALEVGRTLGIEAMADWWATRLGVHIRIVWDDIPRLSHPCPAGAPALN